MGGEGGGEEGGEEGGGGGVACTQTWNSAAPVHSGVQDPRRLVSPLCSPTLILSSKVTHNK